MSNIERAIKNLRAHMYCEIDTLPREVGIAISEAITALQEKLARESGCEHCRGWDVRCGANFCPMCGRKLGSGGHD